MSYVLVGVLSFLGGLVQSIAGFGAGIVMMLGFPYIFTPLIQASGISATCNTFLNYSLVWRYRKIIEWKKIILPASIYLPFSTFFIFVSTSLPQKLLKICFGIFLILLSIYYLTASFRKKEVHMSKPVAIFFFAFSGMCSALFGIGGPLIILYFISELKEPKRYISTTQGFFGLTSTYNLIMRIIKGIIGIKQLPVIILGSLMIILGGLIGSKLINKIDQSKLKMTTYVMVGVAGITNLF